MSRHYQPWLTSELAIVRRFYPSGGADACAPRLPGRSKAAIKARAHLIGVTLDNDARSITARMNAIRAGIEREMSPAEG